MDALGSWTYSSIFGLQDGEATEVAPEGAGASVVQPVHLSTSVWEQVEATTSKQGQTCRTKRLGEKTVEDGFVER